MNEDEALQIRRQLTNERQRRFRMKNKLKLKAVALIEKITLNRPGNMSNETLNRITNDVNSKVKMLRKGWSMEQYERVWNSLTNLEKKYFGHELARSTRTKQQAQLLEQILKLAQASELDSQMLAAVAYDFFCHAATNIFAAKGGELTESKENTLLLLVQGVTGLYPPWFVKRLVDIVYQALGPSDRGQAMRNLQTKILQSQTLKSITQAITDENAAADKNNPFAK